jgi:hypothetical protein
MLIRLRFVRHRACPLAQIPLHRDLYLLVRGASDLGAVANLLMAQVFSHGEVEGMLVGSAAFDLDRSGQLNPPPRYHRSHISLAFIFPLFLAKTFLGNNPVLSISKTACTLIPHSLITCASPLAPIYVHCFSSSMCFHHVPCVVSDSCSLCLNLILMCVVLVCLLELFSESRMTIVTTLYI